MKKLFFALTMMLTTTMGANAMSYEQARNEALFLTDKMAYELNLTDAQYEAAYEINLDYLMGVTGRSDVFGTYWERRNLDLSYILFDWQWNAFVAATYFYRPLYWEAGYWHFGIYRRYPHRDYFYFGRPHFYATYRGGHAWHSHGGHGYYYGHRDHYRPSNRAHYGMHDRWNRGEFRSPSHHSSTRITGRSDHRPNNRTGFDNRQMERRYDNNRGIERRQDNNRGIERRQDNNRGIERRPESRSNSGNFGGYRGNSAPSRSIGGSTPSRSIGGSTPSRSIGGSNFGGSSHGTRSGGGFHGGGSSSMGTRSGGGHSGGSHSGGGHSGGSHFGGRR